MKRLLGLMLALAALLTSKANAEMIAIFYQPQLRDRDLPAERWPALFTATRAAGFDTVVLQWMRHGEAFSDAEGMNWLRERIEQARAAGLHVVLGLHADPAFFDRLGQPPKALKRYLSTLRAQDLDLARTWARSLEPDAIGGWYLTLEIDDLHWRDSSRRRMLARHLKSETRKLRSILSRPVYTTSFFTAQMPPDAYADLIRDLDVHGLRIWIQDGAGTGRLDAVGREPYLALAAQCDATAIRGLVFEVFRQIDSTEGQFHARPLPQSEMSTALQQRAPCAGDSVFFSLRYLPSSEGNLAY